MERLIVSIEHNGEMIPAGFISGNSSADSCFCYSMEYLHREGSTPVSVSLPLQETPFSAAQTRTFFEGLLPEGFTRRMVAQWMHAAEDDYLAILHGLGRECLGALCITLDDLRSMFELLRRSSANPVADQLQLWDNLIFNYLIGNTDAHLKNYSLLYGSNMRTIRLAPS